MYFTIRTNLIKVLLCQTICLIVTLNTAISQTSTHYIYDSGNGLPSSEAYDCIQDSEGNIWVATDNGVSKFNSHEFKNYTEEDGLPGPVVFKLFLDPNQTLWLTGYNRSLCYYDEKNDRFKPYKFAHVLENSGQFAYINDLKFFEETGGMGFQTSTGYYEISNSGVLKDKSDRETNFVFTVRSKKHISYINKSNREPTTVKLVIPNGLDTIITCDENINRHGSSKCFRAGQNEYYVFFANTLIHVKNDQITRRIFKNTICDFALWKGSLYVGLYSDGLVTLDTTTLETKSTAFSGHTISGLHIDDEKSLWLTSTELGLIYLPSTHFENFLFTETTDNFVYSVQYNGRIFVLQKSKYLYEFDVFTQRYKHISEKGNLTEFSSKLVLRGSLLFGYSGYIQQAYDIEQNSFVRVRFYDGILLNDSLVLGGHGTGLSLRTIHDRFTTKQELLSGKNVSQLFEYEPKKILISLKPGLMKLDASDVLQLNPEMIKKDIHPTSTTLWNENVIITTKTKGVWCYRGDRIFQLSDKLPNVKYTDCAIRGDQLYFSSANGLYVYDAQTDHVTHYGKFHGLTKIDLLNVYLGNDGNIWLVTRSGLIRLNETTDTKEFSPSVSLNYVIADADTIQNKNFHYDHKVIEFQVSSICFKCLGDLTYKYRLKGVSDNWLEGKQDQIHFNSLPAGDYTFEIIAITPNGKESSTYTYSFTIPLPFWKTWWFSLLVIACCVLGLLLFLSYRRNLRLKEAQLVEELTYNRQLALRKYLNPHFIFNSLNSIQSFVVNNEKDEAQSFIAQFSTLMREYFDDGINEEILLKKELEVLDQYVEIEEKRLQKPLYFDYSVSPTIDLNKTYIPSFILQPIIENAIWHGFGNTSDNDRLNKNRGTIHLSIAEVDRTLRITIRDNGKGDTGNSPKSQNSSIDVNKKRLDLLSKLHKQKFELIRGNIMGNDGMIIGYEVFISLPFRCVGSAQTTSKKRDI